MTIVLLSTNFLILLLVLVLVRALMVVNDKLDIIKKDQNEFQKRNADLWEQNANILRNTLQ